MRDWPPVPVPRHRRAVFLDRDGTINVDSGYPHRVEELEFIPGALAGLRRLAALPLDVVVISNQAGIALGLYDDRQMAAFNESLRSQVEAAGGRIDAIYYCPALEPKDLPPGAAPSPCSKPAPGMLLEAAADLGLELAASFLIGDKRSDIVAGTEVGCRTILVRTGGRVARRAVCRSSRLTSRRTWRMPRES